MCKRLFGIIVKHLSGGRVQAARPCGWPCVAGAAVGELVDPGPRQGGLHTAAVPGLNILYINVEEYSCIHAYCLPTQDYKSLNILDFQKCNKDKGMTYPNSKLSKKSALFVSRQRKYRRNKLVNSYFLSVVAASIIFLSCFEIIFQSWTK